MDMNIGDYMGYTPRTYCNKYPAVAYYSGFGGLEIHGIIYGINDSVIYTTGAWGGGVSYHKTRVYYNASGDPFFMCNGIRVPFDDCIRTEAGV